MTLLIIVLIVVGAVLLTWYLARRKGSPAKPPQPKPASPARLDSESERAGGPVQTFTPAPPSLSVPPAPQPVSSSQQQTQQ